MLCSVAAAGGQHCFNKYGNRASRMDENPAAAEKSSWSAGWLPMKSLSDSEYQDILQKRLSKIESEMENVDRDIALLRAYGEKPKVLDNGGAFEEPNPPGK